MNNFLSFILILFIGFVVGYCSRPQTDTIVKTEIKTDTLRIDTPTEVRVDTFMQKVFVPVKQKADTVFHTDSILVYLPFERKVYEDSTYRAVISGYQPVLEEIDVYAKETIIYKEKSSPRFSPYVSGGINFNGGVSLGGGVFLKDKDALGVEWSNRGLQVRYIHKF
jgi:hypothetical protein